MNKILRKHKGYTTYQDICNFQKLYFKLKLFKQNIDSEIDKCTESYFGKSSASRSSSSEIIDFFQNIINLLFFGYSSLTYAIMENEKILQKTYDLKHEFSDLYKRTIDNACHNSIIFARNRLNHGADFEFKWSATINYKTKLKSINFILPKEIIDNAYNEKKAKDKAGVEYIISKDRKIKPILTEHYEMI
ncbi:hypothetical protein [Desulfovibrio psychrotolerans]|uniref:Uncharacterized protein n=1 Tax=Desulfovibrio psychrotolerans TaxID=415242 RepID=A0A7J0BWC6_9BACT|nr:hypothetical protein [Desulfovibrio psychrotolerans]GFM38019.1 hypothetical protein DSM19430T_27030 [Desulfovibrio psychrotolerans]